MKLIMILTSLLFICSCTPRPIANLQFGKVEFDPHHYDVIFDSDVYLENIYPKDYWRSPSDPKLICTINEPPSNGVAYDSHKIARGDINFIGTQKTTSKYRHRYRAHLLFALSDHRNIARTPVSPQALIEELKNVSLIACKVRISHYVGPPYYSEVINLPSTAFIRIANEILSKS